MNAAMLVVRLVLNAPVSVHARPVRPRHTGKSRARLAWPHRQLRLRFFSVGGFTRSAATPPGAERARVVSQRRQSCCSSVPGKLCIFEIVFLFRHAQSPTCPHGTCYVFFTGDPRRADQFRLASCSLSFGVGVFSVSGYMLWRDDTAVSNCSGRTDAHASKCVYAR
jgi:hypothetical protein